MPLTPFQREIAQLLASHRDPNSHVAGGAVINRSDASPRISADLDLFHDVAASVRSYAEVDEKTLEGHCLAIEWLEQRPGIYRARVSRGTDQLKLEWACDSCFRFFPVQKDPVFGYCLHQADLATNKVLALAGRSEIRDLLDTLYLHNHYLSLGAMCWAACGKDQGFTPWSILEHANRHVKFREEHLASQHLAYPATLPDLKHRWFEAVADAEKLLPRLPANEVGCLYLDTGGFPVTPDPACEAFSTLVRHFGSLHGAWPKLS